MCFNDSFECDVRQKPDSLKIYLRVDRITENLLAMARPNSTVRNTDKILLDILNEYRVSLV